jgi:hypothetical protein
VEEVRGGVGRLAAADELEAEVLDRSGELLLEGPSREAAELRRGNAGGQALALFVRADRRRRWGSRHDLLVQPAAAENAAV